MGQINDLERQKACQKSDIKDIGGLMFPMIDASITVLSMPANESYSRRHSSRVPLVSVYEFIGRHEHDPLRTLEDNFLEYLGVMEKPLRAY